jgi:putative transposase
LLKISTSSFYYKARLKNDDPIIEAFKNLADQHYRWGFWMMHHYLRNEGATWNHKRTYRVYTSMNLNLRSKRRKRLPKRTQHALLQPLHPNIHWSMDFMQDNLSDGKKFRVLNVIDDFNRECLAIVPSKSITSHRVISELENLTTWRGVPEKIRVDNGPEFIAERLKDWCFFKGIELTFIQPGKPAQNGYIERFNRTFRDEVLSMHLFSSLESFKNTAHQWVHVYNHKHPHCSLANLSPRNFLLKHAKPHLIDSDFPTFQIDN